MYGWRGKLGFVNPSICDTVALELYRIMPEGVLITPVNLNIQNLVDDEFKEYLGKVEEAARIVNYEDVHAILVAGTPPIVKMGFDAEEQIIKRVEALTGKPTSTGPTAEVEAMKSLGFRRIAMVGPHTKARTENLKSYFQYRGFEVVVTKGLDIVKNADLTKLPFYKSYVLAREAFQEANGNVDGIYITCPRWPTVESIAPIERDLGVPVVAAAQALVWKGLKLLNIREVRAGFGKLFDDFNQI